MSGSEQSSCHVPHSDTSGALVQSDVSCQIFFRSETLEAITALTTLEDGLTTVRALVVDHVAKLRSFDVAEQALEKLICSASSLVDYVFLHEAHVAGIMAVPVAHSLFDHLFQRVLQA